MTVFLSCPEEDALGEVVNLQNKKDGENITHIEMLRRARAIFLTAWLPYCSASDEAALIDEFQATTDAMVALAQVSRMPKGDQAAAVFEALLRGQIKPDLAGLDA